MASGIVPFPLRLIALFALLAVPFVASPVVTRFAQLSTVENGWTVYISNGTTMNVPYYTQRYMDEYLADPTNPKYRNLGRNPTYDAPRPILPKGLWVERWASATIRPVSHVYFLFGGIAAVMGILSAAAFGPSWRTAAAFTLTGLAIPATTLLWLPQPYYVLVAAAVIGSVMVLADHRRQGLQGLVRGLRRWAALLLLALCGAVLVLLRPFDAGWQVAPWENVLGCVIGVVLLVPMVLFTRFQVLVNSVEQELQQQSPDQYSYRPKTVENYTPPLPGNDAPPPPRRQENDF